jgi:serine/threonine-protein kinase
LIGKLGEGGMGVVYLALQRPLDRQVALKLISGLDPTEETIARFKREATAISSLDHPNIVKLHDFGVAKLSGDDEIELPFMALEYVKHGRTLRRAFAEWREERGGAPIPGDMVLAIFSQILNALAEAHKAGIIHRDMKPENVMIAPVEGNPYFVKVLDFGLAKAVGEMAWALGSFTTRSDIFLGTAFYMAPEQAPHSGEVRHVDHRADLYAVAIMLFEVFTGVRPFNGSTPIEVIMKKVDSRYDPLSLKEAQGLPRGLREFLRKGMAKDPEARFASASEMLKALEAALTGRTTSALGFVPHPRSSLEERPKTPPSSPGEEASSSAEADDESIADTELLEGSKALGSKSWFRSKWLLGIVVPLVIVFLGGAFWFLRVSGDKSEGISRVEPLATTPTNIAPQTPEPKATPLQVKDIVPEKAVSPSPPPPAQMKVRFESEPKGAEVYCEGRLLGKTPFDEVFVGESSEREFEFKMEGYRTERIKSLVKDGAVVRITMEEEYPEP